MNEGARAHKMVAVIIVAYVCLWTPYFVLQFVRLMSPAFCRSRLGHLAQLFAAELGALNSGVNVVVYASLNRDFRYSAVSI